MKNNSVQTTVVLGFSAQLLAIFTTWNFLTKTAFGQAAALVRGAMQPKKGSQPQAATPSSDLEVLKLM